MEKLHIIITVDPEIPVPPLFYGGIERVVYMLILGLVERGHSVYLFANAQSRTPAKLIPYRGLRSGSFSDTLHNALQIKSYIRKIGSVDVIHSFSRLAYLFPLFMSSLPKIQSYQRPITHRSIYLGNILSGKSITFTACSKYCAGTADFIGGRWVVIPNGVSIEKYRFVADPGSGAPLVYLGRIERIKGVHTAIAVAKMTHRNLIIAGNHAPLGAEHDYFVKEIMPYCDGAAVSYLGPVDDNQKNELLGRAAALLFPVEWEEPFGIVMVEALACGTPVIGFGRGAVPEVIRHGETGFLCNSIEAMADAVAKIPLIERARCRRDAEERFSDSVITGEYEKLYYDSLTNGR